MKTRIQQNQAPSTSEDCLSNHDGLIKMKSKVFWNLFQSTTRFQKLWRGFCTLSKSYQDKATNASLIRTRGSHFNSNTDLKTSTRVVFQLKHGLHQVGDTKVAFNTKCGSCVDHKNVSLSSFMFQLRRGSD